MRERERRFEVHEASDGRIYIDDDDFHWDALLRIQGDFENDAARRQYAEAIAKVLSEHEDQIPHRPDDNGNG